MTKTPIKHQILASDDLPKVLIAGGASFLGVALTELLLEKGCFVYCLDNLSSSHKQNLKPIIKGANYKFSEYDIIKPLKRLNLPKFDYLFHLAGLENHPGEDLTKLFINSQGTKNLLDLAREQGSKFLLVSSPLVFSSAISLDDLKNYFGKRQSSDSFYTQAEARRFSETLVFEYFKDYDLDCRIVRLVDIYGPGMSLESLAPINKLISKIQSDQVMEIAGNGEREIYPTNVKDAAYGLVKAMMMSHTTGKIITLANPQTSTILKLAHFIKGSDSGDLKISFVESAEENVELDQEELSQAKKELNWEPKINLNEGFLETLRWLKKNSSPKINWFKKTPALGNNQLKKTSTENGQIHLKKEKEIKTKIKPGLTKVRIPKLKLNRFILISFLVLMLVLIVFSPVLAYYYFLKRGTDSLQRNKPVVALSNLQSSKSILLNFNWYFSLPWLKNFKQDSFSLLNLELKVLELETKQMENQKNFHNLISIFLQGDRGDILQITQNIKANLEQIYQESSLIEGDLTAFNTQLLNTNSYFLNSLKNKLVDLQKKLPEFRKELILARDSLVIIPDILSLKQKQTFLILIQDNLELRPTGGFITTYGLLSLEKGKLVDFSVDSVFAADSQLKGHVELPALLKKYLGETNWYLRDSNWSISFPEAAKQAQWFVEKELNRPTQGVIALDYIFIKDLLSILGPIQTTEDNELVSSNNFWEKVVYYSNNDNSFGGNKKDFVEQVVAAIFEKIKRLNEQEWQNLLGIFRKDLEEKHLLISFTNASQDTDSFLGINGWDGQVRQQILDEDKNEVNDFAFLVEANLGVNKANYFLKRQITQEIKIEDENNIVNTLTISYQNESPSQNWPAGDYKNYLRFYLPLKGKILKIKMGKDVGSQEVVDESKLTHFEEFGKQGVGFLANIPAKDQRIVTISYHPGIPLLKKDNTFSYVLFWQKQPGTSADPLNVIVNYPTGFKVVKLTPQAKVETNKISFIGDAGKDRVYIIDFLK